MRKYFGVAPGLLVEGNAVWVYAVGHKSSEVGPKFLMPWKDRMNALMSLISLSGSSDAFADRKEGRKEGCSRERLMKALGRVTWESNWLVRTAKLKVSTTSWQRRSSFQEIFVRPVVCQENSYMLSNVQLLQFYLQLWYPKPPM